jgi:hypothetical protein
LYPILHWLHEFLADPAVDTSLLILIVFAEVHAVIHSNIQTNLARKTYELYKTYFEVTEKRKAEAREKAAATRAAKKQAALPAPDPPPPVIEDEIPPAIILSDELEDSIDEDQK